MRRFIAAVSLAVFAGPAFSQAGGDAVANPQECPPGTSAIANYDWQDGRFVRDGWACQMESGD